MVEKKSRDTHPSHSIGASELRSTAGDLIKWLRAVDLGEPVDVFALEYPYGWGVREYYNRRAIEQSGITRGFISAMAIFPDDDLYIVVLSNIRAGKPQAQTHIDLAGLALGEDVEPLALPKLSRNNGQNLSNVVGRYDFPGVGPIAISAVSGVLEFEWEGFDLSSYLYPLENGRYWNRLDGAEIDFAEANGEPATALVWGPGENEVRAPRLEIEQR